MAATTINSGDTIVGGAGTDTLTIAVSATNNNSLTGLTVSGVETVNISNASLLGTSSPVVAAAQTAKDATAVTLATRQSEASLAASTDAAADRVVVLANLPAGSAEFAVVQASTATVATAAARAAAALHYDTLVATEEVALAAAITADPTSAATIAAANALLAKINALAAAATADATYAMPTAAVGGAVTFTIADVRFVATQVKTAMANGADLTVSAATAAGLVAAADAVIAREAEVDAALDAVNVEAQSTLTTDVVADQESAAAAAIAAGVSDADLALFAAATTTVLAGSATGTGATGAYTRLNTNAFTVDQFSAAARATLVASSGAAVAATGLDERADEIAALKASVAAVNVDFSIAQLNTAAVNATRDVTGTTILTAGDDRTVIDARADARAVTTQASLASAATAAETALAADVAAQNTLTVALAGVAGNTLAASTFADATLISLSGTSGTTSVSAVAATQTIGFSAVTLANTVTFGTTVASGSLAINGSAGTLTVTGAAMTALNISGTGSTGLTITDGGQAVSAALVDTIATLNLSTTGATVLNTAAMTVLTALTQTGAGGVTLTAANALATITTGAGADLLNVITATAVDNPGTTLVETVNAVVNSGAGADRLVINTSGAGTTTVDAGDGNDTLFVNGLSTGLNSLSGGEGSDVFRIASGSGLVSGLQNTTINGGGGTDTLRVSNTTFSASDYATLIANVTNVETLELAAVVTALDASRIATTGFDFRAAGALAITEVANGDTVSLTRTPAAAAVTGFIGATTEVLPSGITIASAGYLLDSDTVTGGDQTAFGDSLNVTLNQTAANTTVAANGNALNLTVFSLGEVQSTTTGASVTAQATTATVTGNLQSISATLNSARGTGSTATTTALGTESMAGLTITLDSNAETGAGTQTLLNLTSVTASGSGVVTIDARTDAVAKLTTINLSGMTAFANLDNLGRETDGTTLGQFQNLTRSTVTLDNGTAETVILGGARDTIVTGSTILAVDTITGFTLVAQAANPLLADTARSDVLNLGTTADGDAAFSGATGGNAAKMVVTGATLEAALLQAASLKAADGTTNVQNVVFHFGGDTYVFQDKATGGASVEGLDDGDFLVRLTGLQNLDLLIGGSVLGG